MVTQKKIGIYILLFLKGKLPPTEVAIGYFCPEKMTI